MAAAAVLRYFGASVRVFADHDRLCRRYDCCSFFDVDVTDSMLELMELILGEQLAESTSRLQNAGIQINDEVRALLIDLIERSDTVCGTLEDVLRP